MRRVAKNAESEGSASKPIVCPYCHSSLGNKEELSDHIDKIHLQGVKVERDIANWWEASGRTQYCCKDEGVS